MMHTRFGLTLMVTHECNLRCSYCYTGAKFARSMSEQVGRRAIDRALASLSPGGTLELGFFGGEPLLEARLIAALAEYARRRTADCGARLEMFLTTNGTVTDPEAWAVMTSPDVALAVSFDGLPEVHDRHRCFTHGHGSASVVLETMRRLIEAGKELRVVVVVEPGEVHHLPEGIAFLRDLGVRQVEPTLDLWAHWHALDAWELQRAVSRAARVWRDSLPGFSVSWFDEKAARLCRFPLDGTARCSFGDGEIAVAPSGHLYPCERLIGEDRDSNPMRLPGNVLEGGDFLGLYFAPPRCTTACSVCTVAPLCNTTCRCSNYVRTGNVAEPDALLCLWNQACLRETARALDGLRTSVPVGIG